MSFCVSGFTGSVDSAASTFAIGHVLAEGVGEHGQVGVGHDHRQLEHAVGVRAQARHLHVDPEQPVVVDGRRGGRGRCGLAFLL